MDTSEHEYTDFAFAFAVSIYDMPYLFWWFYERMERVPTYCCSAMIPCILARCMDVMALGLN